MAELGRRHLFYGDLNCPFCFAQNERLERLGAHHLVEWRGIEHLPRQPVPPVDDPAERRSIAGELTRLRLKAPDVEVRDPRIRPNTHLATAAVAVAAERDGLAAARLRTELYRALWQEGQDISSRAVVLQRIRAAGLGALDLDAGSAAVRRCTEEWERGAFERRLPAIVSRSGDVLLGLATEDSLRSFIWMQPAQADPLATCATDDPKR
ncbi:MAG: DsbA family protein [Sandaracinaceae bacterium]